MTRSAKPINRRAVRVYGAGGARPLCVAASLFALVLPLVAGCSSGGYSSKGADAAVHDLQGPPTDPSPPDLVTADLAGATDLRAPSDFATARDLGAATDFAAASDMAGGPITGGPCLGGRSGATALRVRWTDGGSGRATVSYEVSGLPDKSRWKVSAAGYSIGFTPQFVDPFLGAGGLQLDADDFVDIEISTIGVHHIAAVTLAILGRSYSTGSSGSFSWQTAAGVDSTAINYVSNVAPYRWYPADVTAAIGPDDGSIYVRVKAGGSSGALVVNRLEICIDAS